MNSAASNSSRTMRRSDLKGEINEHNTMRPASVISFATSPYAPDIFHTVELGKSEVSVQPVPNIIAIQHGGMNAACVKAEFHQVGDG